MVAESTGELSKYSTSELTVMAIGDIIQELIKAQEAGRDTNLNKVKAQVSSKYGLSSTPKLVDIIAAVPTELRKTLVPKLKAKPIRTASGVCNLFDLCCIIGCETCLIDCSGCCHVQTSSLSSY